MRSKSLIMAAAVSALLGTAAFAQAPNPNTNYRGTVTSFDGKVIGVKTNDGRDLSINLPETVAVNATKAFTMADVKPGMKLGVTTVKGPNGAVMAIDVRPIPATANEGLSPYDLAPESTMTNGVVEATAVSATSSELTINYKTGTVKALVTPSTAMSAAVPGERSDIKPGETIFVAARKEGDQLIAARVQVSKNGVKPTQ
jgi:hypothetical protein